MGARPPCHLLVWTRRLPLPPGGPPPPCAAPTAKSSCPASVGRNRGGGWLAVAGGACVHPYPCATTTASYGTRLAPLAPTGYGVPFSPLVLLHVLATTSPCPLVLHPFLLLLLILCIWLDPSVRVCVIPTSTIRLAFSINTDDLLLLSSSNTGWASREGSREREEPGSLCRPAVSGDGVGCHPLRHLRLRVLPAQQVSNRRSFSGTKFPENKGQQRRGTRAVRFTHE